jgi:8-oxo-dGTP pyrophosphatase MutT (NUDIX family)
MSNYMVAVERFINAEGPAIRACGFVTRDLTHFHGVPHTTVLIVPVRAVESGKMEILIHRRPPNKKVSPDTWDTFGGHVEVSIQNGKLLPPGDKIEDRGVLYQLIDSTAIREANEEIKIPGFRFTDGEVHRFGGYGDFECGTHTSGAENVEYSTVFVAVLPQNAVSIIAQDTVGRGGVEVEVSNLRLRSVTLEDLLTEYSKKPSEFANGLGRILEQLVKVPGTRRSFETFLSSLTQGI